VLVPDLTTLEDLLDGRGEASRSAKAAGLGSVYEDLRTLELTRRMLAENPRVEVPADNRRLVEGVTHPESLSQLTGERWERHGQKVAGSTLAEELAGYYAAARFRTAFTDLPSIDIADKPKARTRLGLDTLRIPLPDAPISPFGRPCPEIIVPGHLLPGVSRDEAPADLEVGAAGFRFTLAGTRFRYTRFGLEKEIDEPTD
jgi:CRISPR-associated endonuclease/helicase Cas3